ncbi:N-acetylmuramoyl-L-alanine amidase [Virgibacillus sp. NKC19-16]|uniref:N-acetylmuramoyl-L-alanine amidase n=1 Tax=Virgibacillus salidurans TaxID=2831673 RepID=UPI001F2780EF|nr:N-acetylmuramoyl-L-alanine amidase [Virgibacillus sp. NKC19-16]UJL46189.1 N-acetylmuramoyl-L-alanine amidase [Virgibacillus sp. NKC19-16]
MKFIRYFTVGMAFLLFLFLFIPTSQAENGDTYEVSNTVNVRNAPAAGAEIIGMLSKGDTIVAFQEQHGWVQTYYAGEEAWVAKHHLFPIVSSVDTVASENASEKITVTANNVHIRTGPSTNHTIIGRAAYGDTYNTLDTAGDWHKVSLANGSTGWIAAWLTDSTTSSEETVAAPTSSESNDTAAENENSSGSLEGYTIVLDPGHGGKDPGAIGLNGIYEKDLAISTTDKVETHLLDAGANVTVTRTGDYFIPLDERTQISHGNNADAFISLHYDAFPILSVNGVTTYFHSNGTDRHLAEEIQASLASKVNLQDRGVLQGDYRVLRNNNAPSVITELGFITNQSDLATVQTADYQNNVAQAITNGLKNYFNE